MLIHNEQTKLSANALDRASTACLTVGILAPMAAFLYAETVGFALSAIIFGAVIWLGAALVLHMAARWILRRLR